MTLAINKDGIKGLLKIVETAFKRLHKNGKYAPEDLAKTKAYKDLISQTSTIFNGAIADNDIPEAMVKSLKEDTFIFSGLKTNAQLAEASQLLLTDDGKVKSFSAFSKDVESIKTNYNQNYLEAEYQFAVSSSQSAGNWASISSDYDLQYRTAGDDRVRDSHDKLRDVTLPTDDAFWLSYYPPNGWRCRCTAVQVRKGKFEVSDSKKAITEGEKATKQIGKDGKNKLEIFRFNPGIQKVVFPPTHPYTKVAGAEKVRKELKNGNNAESKILNKNAAYKESEAEAISKGKTKAFKELSIVESTAIFMYTKVNGTYSHINTYNRTGVINQRAKNKGMEEPFIKAITKTINNGLDKIPERHKGLVYRNVFLDKEGIAVYQKAFDSSKIHTEKGFMSTTTIKGGVFAGNVSFTVKAKNGAVIEKLSEMADEKEVLFKSQQKFKVTGFKNINGGEYEINLEEI